MLGQSKTVHQAEIDAACELIDFWRFNVDFAARIYQEQPLSGPGMWNQIDYRPLEGFVFAVTPFNFTSIAANLPTAPALMGNTVVWKPSLTQAYSAHYLMKLLEAAGLPPGCDQHGARPRSRDRRGGTGHPRSSPASTSRARRRRSTGCGARSARTSTDYRNYPRIVGETGGKDFIVAHPSARSRCARHGDRSRRLRVPGAEVLGCVARLRGFEPVGVELRERLADEVPRSRWATSPTSVTSWGP